MGVPIPVQVFSQMHPEIRSLFSFIADIILIFESEDKNMSPYTSGTWEDLGDLSLWCLDKPAFLEERIKDKKWQCVILVGKSDL